ncbi:hypothetical protein ACHAW5_006219 [Stephanodiscus triporus]|uniref:DUF4200 domain-containing protein n=1 Tax=Stephanodiscus triporus TaxID=2934178 RepID=A0ABD3NLQ6_9STRA
MTQQTQREPKPQFLEHACDSTRILSKKRELYDIKERVAIEKESFDRKSLILQQKEDELAKRELDFQSKLALFDASNKESAAKETELKRRLADEVKICQDLDKEAAALTQAFKERQVELEKLKDLAAKHKIFLDLVGPSKTSDVVDRNESLEQNKARMAPESG